MFKKKPNIFHTSEKGKIENQNNLGLVNLNTITRNNMAKNNPLFHHEVVLFSIQSQIFLPAPFLNFP